MSFTHIRLGWLYINNPQDLIWYRCELFSKSYEHEIVQHVLLKINKSVLLKQNGQAQLNMNNNK